MKGTTLTKTAVDDHAPYNQKRSTGCDLVVTIALKQPKIIHTLISNTREVDFSIDLLINVLEPKVCSIPV